MIEVEVGEEHGVDRKDRSQVGRRTAAPDVRDAAAQERVCQDSNP
jgi:hypothetical protein